LGYVGLGVVSPSALSKEFWQYDASSDTWQRKADLPAIERSNAIGFAIGDKGYLGFGINLLNSANPLNDFWEYNPDTDQWTAKQAFPGLARFDVAGFAIGNSGYIATGNPGSYNDFWRFNP
jgi:N-acetylneuraminic acid mutarotase